jgi:hypothetical protein
MKKCPQNTRQKTYVTRRTKLKPGDEQNPLCPVVFRRTKLKPGDDQNLLCPDFYVFFVEFVLLNL